MNSGTAELATVNFQYSDAFELSIKPGLFLLDVDLYGLGLVYKGGYRAETQVVNRLTIPKRCVVCSSRVKASDKLTIGRMEQESKIAS